MKKYVAYMLVIMFGILLISSNNFAQDTKLNKWVFGSGGMVYAKNAEGESMSGIIGQLAIDKRSSVSNPDLITYQGFWSPLFVEVTGVDDNNVNLLSNNELINYPNPFSNYTNVTFNLASYSYITIKIYDVMGNEVKELYTGLRDAGQVVIPWDAKNSKGDVVPSGSYMYELQVKPAQVNGDSQFQSFNLRNVMIVVK